ncbi:MAG TPA: TonB-dependent receptor plug domain-containing protein, partial [Draconibacterium sp.]|nr:TonB-dependent receptor plug domain-containing protein [Draconibacterium sp.]
MKKGILKTLFFGLFSLLTVTLYAQINVSGTVKSDAGELLPGVSIIVKGTSTGVITDINGNFSISVPNAESVLLFSFVGMQPQEVAVNGRSAVDVTLVTSSIGVDEVVVTALGISREKKSLGYSVGEVQGEELTRVAQENVLNSLAGKVSGVQISQTGATGSSVSMVIRGASSLTSDNQPLFVVDGVPMNNTLNNISTIGNGNLADYGNSISDLSGENIENVSILKGPSAAALYGSRAGNGVVLITTKSGKKKTGLGVSITSNTVIESPYKYLEKHTKFANGQRPFTQENRPNNGLDYYVVPVGDSYWVGPELDSGMKAYQWPYFNEAGVPEATLLVSHPDNFSEFFETGVTSTNGFSVNDANEKVNYRLSYENMQNKGIIPNSDLNKNTISLNSTFNVTKKIALTTNFNFANSGADNRPA